MLVELLFSVLRMFISYVLSLGIAYIIGYLTYKDKGLERFLLPLVDVLQSVPILTFFPIALFLIVHNLPSAIGPEVAVIFLIITSMVWNLIFAVYESFLSMPQKYKDIIRLYKLNKVERFFRIYLPLTLKNVIPNSIVSWANGWYFLIATEIITVGGERFALRGIGSLMLNSATAGDYGTTVAAIGAVTAFIILMNIFVWKPLSIIVSTLFGGREERSIYDIIIERLPKRESVVKLLRGLLKKAVVSVSRVGKKVNDRVVKAGIVALKVLAYVVSVLAIAGAAYAAFWAWGIASDSLLLIARAFIKSLLRIVAAFLLSLLWTLPVAYLIWRVKVLEDVLVPLFEIAASIPVTAIFPLLAVVMINSFGNIEFATLVFLMTGMQWYIFFNFYGALRSLPKFVQDLKKLYKLSEVRFLEKIALPASMGLLIVGSISAIGGGWNAVIVSEYISVKGQVFSTEGIGQIMSASLYGEGNLALLILASLAVGITVPLTNIFIWRPLMKEYSGERWKF